MVLGPLAALALATALHGSAAFASHDPTRPPVAAIEPLGAATRPPALRPIRHVEMREPTVAMTFDACATKTKGYTFNRGVYEVLRRERVPATIFVSGRWVESHPDVMAELAREPLIEFGDHSYDHPHMTKISAARIAAEIDETEAALGRYGKRSVAFRPPFGEWSRRVIDVVGERQLPVVTWDVVSGDPSARTTTSQMIRNVVGKARAGSIVVFHINGRGWKTAEALPTIVRELRERGFRFVQLSELLGAGTGVVPAEGPPAAVSSATAAAPAAKSPSPASSNIVPLPAAAGP